MNDVGITIEQAYLAMYEFLVEVYSRTQSDELGALLGGMSYLDDGGTADPAAWTDWIRCVERVLSGKGDGALRLK